MTFTLSENICVKGEPATCGSKMLENYIAPYTAAVVERLIAHGAAFAGRIPTGEFSGGGVISVGDGTVGLYPTAGTVPLYGSIATNELDRNKITARLGNECGAVMDIIADITDGPADLTVGSADLTVGHGSPPLHKYAQAAYDIITCAEMSSNLGKLDGIRYGYSADCDGGFNDLVKQSRNEGLSKEVKKRILLGNYMLLKGNYDKYYRKALIIKQQIKREFAKIFETADAVVVRRGDLAAAHLAGLPVVTTPEYTFVGKPFSDHALLAIAAKEASL